MAQIQKKFIAANSVDGTKIRLSNAEALRARNAANSGDISMFEVNSSDVILMLTTMNANALKITNMADPTSAQDAATKAYVDAHSGLSTTLTSAHIYVGNGSNVATDVAVSGDLTLANTGAFTIASAAVTLSKLASNSVDENKIVSSAISTTGALNGGSGTKLSVRTDSSTTSINGSNQIIALQPAEERITLSGTDITNQYVDLAKVIFGSSASANSATLSAVGGPVQLKTVDYTVSLAGGSGGVTRITFAGDLATGGPAALIAGDILIIDYSYLT